MSYKIRIPWTQFSKAHGYQLDMRRDAITPSMMQGLDEFLYRTVNNLRAKHGCEILIWLKDIGTDNAAVELKFSDRSQALLFKLAWEV